MSRRDDSDDKKGKKHIGILAGALLTLILWKWWPELLPLRPIADFWRWDMHGLLSAVWPIFVWGCGINLALWIGRKLLSRENPNPFGFLFRRSRGREALRIFFRGLIISTWAGIVEEIEHRWLVFLGAIAVVGISNFFFFGFLGFGLAKWFHLNVWGPLADWSTLGHLHTQILSTKGGWLPGAAMLYSNAAFRDGHKYQGLFGILNSWFIGMFLFWVMFTFGLPAAILTHFLYDALIFTLAAVLTLLE